jgi:hypothetical protein
MHIPRERERERGKCLVLFNHFKTYAIRSAKSQEFETFVGNQASGFGRIRRHGCCLRLSLSLLRLWLDKSFRKGFSSRNHTNVSTLRLCKSKNNRATKGHLKAKREEEEEEEEEGLDCTVSKRLALLTSSLLFREELKLREPRMLSPHFFSVSWTCRHQTLCKFATRQTLMSKGSRKCFLVRFIYRYKKAVSQKQKKNKKRRNATSMRGAHTQNMKKEKKKRKNSNKQTEGRKEQNTIRIKGREKKTHYPTSSRPTLLSMNKEQEEEKEIRCKREKERNSIQSTFFSTFNPSPYPFPSALSCAEDC